MRNRVASSRRREYEYEAFGRRKNAPPALAQGMLANLILEKLEIYRDTPVKKSLEFRTRHSEE